MGRLEPRPPAQQRQDAGLTSPHGQVELVSSFRRGGNHWALRTPGRHSNQNPMKKPPFGRPFLCAFSTSQVVSFLGASLSAFILASAILAGGCTRNDNRSAQPTIAVTTSYLESAVRDLVGDDVNVLRLAEPGACPGHFDIRPSQASELRRCRMLLRFDFQSSLDPILSGEGTNQAHIAAVTIHTGLCLPESYLSCCQQVATALVAEGWLSQTNADSRLRGIEMRLDALTQDTTNRVAKARLAGIPVISSGHQKDFCQWLGLKVAATFRAADTASVAEIDNSISTGSLAGTKLIVANLPEGRRTADALAERLKANVVVFGNFPIPKNGRIRFDDLIVQNVADLIKSSGQ
jgi:zinc transport system substrate-binding protein